MKTQPPSMSWRGYVDLLRHAILKLEINNIKNRRLAYNEIERLQKKFFSDEMPGVDEEEQEYHYRMLRTAIRLVERDIRSGIDIFKDNYIPDEIETIASQLTSSLQSRLRRKRPVSVNAAGTEFSADQDLPNEIELLSIAQIKSGLSALDTISNINKSDNYGSIFILRSSIILIFQITASEGKLAVLWLVIQPAVLLTIISLIYLLISTSFILNMDVATFALLGSSTWIMFRQVLYRVAGAFTYNRWILNLPPIRPPMMATAYGIVYFIIYFVVFIILFLGGRLIGFVTPPDNIPLLFICVIGMWAMAFGVGLIFGSIGVCWPFFLRFATVIERVLQLFSSVFFVSEQLPEHMRGWVLWSPSAHGLQLVRSAYFFGYKSTDASAAYFILSILFIVTLGSIMVRSILPRVNPQ